jgi:hypothetical protein
VQPGLPQHAREHVEQQGTEDQHREPEPGRPEEAVGVDHALVERRGSDQRQRTHQSCDADEEDE